MTLGNHNIHSDAAKLGVLLAYGKQVDYQLPLTSTSWDGDSKTTAARGTIDLSAVFGVPAGVKAVNARLQIKDNTAGAYATLGASNLDASCLVVVTQNTTHPISGTAWVPCDANGDIYFYNSETIDEVTIAIWGYRI